MFEVKLETIKTLLVGSLALMGVIVALFVVTYLLGCIKIIVKGIRSSTISESIKEMSDIFYVFEEGGFILVYLVIVSGFFFIAYVLGMGITGATF